MPVTRRQRKEIVSATHPTHPKTEYVLSLFCKFERFIRFDTWGTAPLQQLCQNMVRTWYFGEVSLMDFLSCLATTPSPDEEGQKRDAVNYFIRRSFFILNMNFKWMERANGSSELDLFLKVVVSLDFLMSSIFQQI